jgi:hypothetical protein
MKTSLKQVIDIFEKFAKNHKQISAYTSLPSEEFISKNKLYPFFIVEPADAVIENGQVIIDFNIYALDRIQKDDSNINDVLSRCLLIMEDFWVFFNENLDEYGFYLSEKTTTMKRVAYMFSDMLGGYKMSVKCQVPMYRAEDQIPVNLPI